MLVTSTGIIHLSVSNQRTTAGTAETKKRWSFWIITAVYTLSIGVNVSAVHLCLVLQTGTAQHTVNVSVASAYMLVSAFTMHVPRNI